MVRKPAQHVAVKGFPAVVQRSGNRRSIANIADGNTSHNNPDNGINIVLTHVGRPRIESAEKLDTCLMTITIFNLVLINVDIT
jgi:hypothetical protein